MSEYGEPWLERWLRGALSPEDMASAQRFADEVAAGWERPIDYLTPVRDNSPAAEAIRRLGAQGRAPYPLPDGWEPVGVTDDVPYVFGGERRGRQAMVDDWCQQHLGGGWHNMTWTWSAGEPNPMLSNPNLRVAFGGKSVLAAADLKAALSRRQRARAALRVWWYRITWRRRG